MIHQFGFVSEETFSEKMDTQNRFLAALVTAHGGTLKPSSWAEIQALVRAGLHKNVFSIGDQLVCSKGEGTLTWDVIGIDHDTPSDSQFTHSLTLQTHDCLAEKFGYCRQEALYYAENGLTAGTYNFTIPSGYDTSHGGGKTYQFTLTQDVPVGGQLTFGWLVNTQAVNSKISSYSSATSTTEIEQVSVTEGSSGTSLGTTDGTSTNVNYIELARHGYNNYEKSSLRQYLNSSAAAGSVWTPQTVFDRPPIWASSTAGFMSDLDSDFLAVIGTTSKVTCLNTVTDGGGSVTLTDKFFLLSKSEVYGGDESGIVDEGSPYAYYKDYSDLSEAGISNDSNRIKYISGTATPYWVRTPMISVGYHFRYVDISGNITANLPYPLRGVAPACVIV